MKAVHRHTISIITGTFVLLFLGVQTWIDPLKLDNITVGILFILLIVFTTTFGVPFSGGVVSLLPMSILSAFLILDLVPAGWIAFLGAFINEGVRIIFKDWLGIQTRLTKFGTVAVASANATIQTVSILISSWAYVAVGGITPFSELSFQSVLALFVLAGVYLGTNLGLIAFYMLARGQQAFILYIKSLGNLLLFEASPLIFLPLMPLIYTQLGLGIFLLFATAIVVASLISRSLALTSRGLERRVQELDSLQAVGQALSSNLRLDDILPAIYEEVARLMPAENFYVALYTPDTNEVIFPLVVEESKSVNWQPRKAGKGLTEYLLHSQEALLVSFDLAEKLVELGITQYGKPTTSWLGVPLLAGDESLGVIAVQSFSATDHYDESHKEILVTIAAQAAIAIQNARLYERTDEALTNRVQELYSILRTSNEGMLLLSIDFRILAANRALADFFQVPHVSLSGGDWGSVHLDRSPDLLPLMGYSFEGLQRYCDEISVCDLIEKKFKFSQSGTPTLYLERKLTPVLGPEEQIVGWLIVYRDITEEIELARLREDLTHMLVHDLRSPLSALRGSLWIIRQNIADLAENNPALGMVDMAERNADSMVTMVDSLLDIAKLETGQMPLHTQAVSISKLFNETIASVNSLARDANIDLSLKADPELPDLLVDLEHTRRVLINLVDNGIKFTPDGGHILLWARLDDKTYPATILMGVTDSGPGITDDAKKRLFLKFQTDSSVHGRRKGTGLGLAYCKLVVEAHGGEIWVESQVDKGSTFNIRLPVA